MAHPRQYPGPVFPDKAATAGQRKREERALRSHTFYPVLSVKQVQDLVKGAES